MAGLQREVEEALARLRAAGTDLHTIEVKRAAGGLPRSVADTVSAFANTDGGLLVLGIDENDGFGAVAIDAPKLASDLASLCADGLEPPIRAEIDVVTIEGVPVVAAQVEELATERKPCFVKALGMDRGSFRRTHDGDRALSSYEVHILVGSRGQPVDDLPLVAGATLADLDPALVDALVNRLRSTRGTVFLSPEPAEILDLVGVTRSEGDASGVTLAGLLALGKYPQRFFPQLDVTFVMLPTESGEPLADGTRFIDNQSIDGPIPAMIAGTLIALRRNMKRRAVIVGAGREDIWEYPEAAIRELVANALMHRDHHPLSHGTQVRVELYPDRLEIISPGGLHGPVIRDDLLAEAVSSSRNASLAKLLEDVEIPGTEHRVCENRATGLLATAAALRRAGLPPPAIIDTVRQFRAVVHNRPLLDDGTVAWLASLGDGIADDRQRLGLALARRRGSISTQQYRMVTGVDGQIAAADLAALADAGLLDRRGERRRPRWVLTPKATPAAIAGTTEQGRAASPRTHEDRREAILALLADGPASSAEMGAALGLTREAVRYWLRTLEADGKVRPTAVSRRSRFNTWELVS